MLAGVRLRLGGYVRGAGGCFLSRFRFAHAKRNVREFQKAGAAGIANLPVVPGAVTILPFKGESG